MIDDSIVQRRPASSSLVTRGAIRYPFRLMAIGHGLAPILLITLIAGRRWWQLDGFVTGNDPGNWLAVGRSLFQDGGKTTSFGFPPLVPALAYLGQRLLDPMLTAQLLGIGSLVVVMLATYLVAAAGMRRWFALGMTGTAGLAGILTETVAFGGYPQNYALGFLLLSALATSRFLVGGSPRWAIGGAAALCAVALTHHAYFALAGAILAAVWTIWLTTGPMRTVAIRRTLSLAAMGLASVLCFLPTIAALVAAGYDAPVNAGDADLAAGVRYTIREAPWIWLPLWTTAAGYLGLTFWQRVRETWNVAAALMSCSALLYVVTAESRLLPPLTIGACIGLGLALDALWTQSRGATWGGLPLAAAAIIPLILWPSADGNADRTFAYYRVADAALMETADFVDAHADGGIVIVRSNHNGWPLGWWFEGLTDARVVVDADPRWLGFEEERENAQLASFFFGGNATGPEISILADRYGVTLLVTPKWEWIGWRDWLGETNPRITLLYENDTYVVLSPDAR